MTVPLSEAQQSRYRRDGIVFPVPVLSTGEAADYRRHCDELESRLGGKPRTIEVRQMHLHFPWAYRLATHPNILDAVESLLGPDLLVWATELFAKHPNDPNVSIGWHRDLHLHGLDRATHDERLGRARGQHTDERLHAGGRPGPIAEKRRASRSCAAAPRSTD
jgi:hypothetical protein